MEGYAVVIGPKLFIVSPGIPGGFYWLRIGQKGEWVVSK
jgi:hypothetical protein